MQTIYRLLLACLLLSSVRIHCNQNKKAISFSKETKSHDGPPQQQVMRKDFLTSGIDKLESIDRSYQGSDCEDASYWFCMPCGLSTNWLLLSLRRHTKRVGNATTYTNDQRSLKGARDITTDIAACSCGFCLPGSVYPCCIAAGCCCSVLNWFEESCGPNPSQR